MIDNINKINKMNNEKIKVRDIIMEIRKIFYNHPHTSIVYKPIVKQDFPEIIREILKENGGKMYLMDVSKAIWAKHKERLMQSDMFYEGQYIFRWGATELRKKNIMKNTNESDRGCWELK